MGCALCTLDYSHCGIPTSWQGDVCIISHGAHTVYQVYYCSYLLLFRTSEKIIKCSGEHAYNYINFVPEKIEKWTRELNYHEESTQDEELVAIYNLASLVAKFSIFFG